MSKFFRWSRSTHDREDLGGPLGLCCIDPLIALGDDESHACRGSWEMRS